MANSYKKELKYSVTFWQMFSIVVVAAVLGGIILDYAYNNQLFDEVNSIQFIPQQTTKTPTKTPVKAPVKKTVK